MRHRASGEGSPAPSVTRPPHGTAGDGRITAPSVRSRSLAWAGYAAAAWSFLFSLQSFYYAAGGTAGARTWPPAIAAGVLARDPRWIALMWGTGAVKVVAGLFALALVRPWGRAIPRRLRVAAACGAVAIMGGYEGVASLVQHALMLAGVIAIPTGLGRTAAWWHLLLWDPWWLIGGIVFWLASGIGMGAATV